MLRRQPEKILFTGTATTTAIGTTDVQVNIPGYGSFLCSEMVQWIETCASDGTAGVWTVDFCPPSSCDCPECMSVEIVIEPNTLLYDTANTFETRRLYEYCSPTGSSLTSSTTVLSAAVQAIADMIDADEYFEGSVSTPATGDACGELSATASKITITGAVGQDFSVYSAFGTVANPTPFVRGVLSQTDVNRIFPLKPGSFGSDPAAGATTCCATGFCVYHAVLKRTDVQDIDSTNVENYLYDLYIYTCHDEDATGETAFIDVLNASVTSSWAVGNCTPA